MNLDKFISHVIESIVKGVKGAQEECWQTGAKINPLVNMSPSGPNIQGRNSQTLMVTNIEFEILLATDSSTSIEGSLGVFLMNIGAGSKVRKEDKYQETSKIKFSIPIALPLQERFEPVDPKKAEVIDDPFANR